MFNHEKWPSKARKYVLSREKTENTENSSKNEDALSWYFNRTVSQPWDRLLEVEEYVEQEFYKEHNVRLMKFFHDALFMTHNLWLNIYDSSFISHNFIKNVKKNEEILESENSDYVMWCNGQGLAHLVELSQKHARKCNETCVPLLNGFKVSQYQGWPDIFLMIILDRSFFVHDFFINE